MIGRRAFLAGLGVVPALAAAPVWAADAFAETRVLAQSLIDDGVTPGFQLSIRKGGDLVFSQGFGLANIETSTPTTSATVFRIGSVTKQFTAAILLLLEQDGRLSLSDTLDRFVPSVPRANEISLLRMLNHTSGLGNYTDVDDPKDFFQAGRLDRPTSEMIDWMVARPRLMVFEPGAGWAYSNTAYVLLGAVIEAVTGQPYGAVMKERLFDPLGLTATAVDDPALILPGRANGYTRDIGDAAGAPLLNASYLSMTFPGAAGAIRSTTDDLCRWHQALFGGRVLGATALETMLTPATLADGSPALTGGQPVNYGLGIGVGPIASHTGGINGFISYLGTHREADVTVATVVNVDGGPDLGPRARAVRSAAWTAAGVAA